MQKFLIKFFITVLIAIVVSSGLVVTSFVTALTPSVEMSHTRSSNASQEPVPSEKNATQLPATVGSGNSTNRATISTADSTVPTVASSSIFSESYSWQQDYSTMPDGPLNANIWNAAQGNNNGWGNNEVEYYTSNAENVRIDRGNLVIEANKTGGTYTSARITTEDKFDFTYGKIDIVAKLPTGRGVWPAIWFWPTEQKYPSQLASSDEQHMAWLNNGEIDLVEGSAWGDSDFSGSAHSLGHYPGHNVRTGKITVSSPSTVFHTYSLHWTPSTLEFLVDGVMFKQVVNSGSGFREWPYDQKYHLILNIAMGGNMSKELISAELPLGIDDASAPWVMQVRSITYYPLAG